MEHVEDVLFDAERALMRRYPSRAAAIQAQTKVLWHRGGVSGAYCAICMAQALKLPVEVVQGFYYSAERSAEIAQQFRDGAAARRRRHNLLTVWGCVVIAGCILTALYA